MRKVLNIEECSKCDKIFGCDTFNKTHYFCSDCLMENAKSAMRLLRECMKIAQRLHEDYMKIA